MMVRSAAGTMAPVFRNTLAATVNPIISAKEITKYMGSTWLLSGRADDLKAGTAQRRKGEACGVDPRSGAGYCADAGYEAKQPIEDQHVAVHEQAEAKKTVRLPVMEG